MIFDLSGAITEFGSPYYQKDFEFIETNICEKIQQLIEIEPKNSSLKQKIIFLVDHKREVQRIDLYDKL